MDGSFKLHVICLYTLELKYYSKKKTGLPSEQLQAKRSPPQKPLELHQAEVRQRVPANFPEP